MEQEVKAIDDLIEKALEDKKKLDSRIEALKSIKKELEKKLPKKE